MYRLTVNKTKMYALAKRYWPEIGPMRRTRFIKVPRCRSYILDFSIGVWYHHVHISGSYSGDVLLSDGWSWQHDDGTDEHGHECRRLKVDELLALGMLEVETRR